MKSPSIRLALALVLLMILSLTGCEWLDAAAGKKTSPPPPPPPPSGTYLDFEDVKMPQGLTLDREGSFVYESQTIKAGVLSLSGSQKVGELLDFFQKNMPLDGWKQLSSFKYRKNILIYTKPDKVCLIVVIYPPPFNLVTLEIWVSPLKPGAEIPKAEGFKSPAAGTGDTSIPGAGGKTGAMPLKKPAGPKEEPLPGDKKDY
ncbi:MAG: hypothetical protein V1742_01325 [Pseudomonadota bacterium]